MKYPEFEKYKDKLSELFLFMIKLQPHADWFRELGIEIYSPSECDRRYEEYLKTFENASEEFLSFHRKGWYPLAKDGKLSVVLDHSDMELIQYHYHCEGTDNNNHYFGICRTPQEMLMLLDTPLSATAFDLACEHLFWTNGFRGQLNLRNFKPIQHVFSAVGLFKDGNNRDVYETHICFPHYIYTYNKITKLSSFSTQLDPANGLTWLNYGIRLKPVFMRFADDLQYLPTSETLTVRDLMKFLIEKLPLQCVELVAFSERHPGGYLHIVNAVIEKTKPDSDNEWLENYFRSQRAVHRSITNREALGTPSNLVNGNNLKNRVLKSWNFSFVYPGSYIPIELLGQFGKLPSRKKKIEEKARDLHEYEEKSITESIDVMDNLLAHHTKKYNFDWRDNVREGTEDEIY